MKHASVPQHNYPTKIRQMWQTGALPREVGSHQLTLYREDFCALINGNGPCHCDPDSTLKLNLSDHAHN